MTELTSPSTEIWWGTYELSADTWACWQIGPLQLYARHGPGEWMFRWCRSEDPMAAGVSFTSSISDEPEVKGQESARYVLEHGSGSLELRPVLADLPFIARPANPLHIPSSQETVLYVSTVVWLQAVNEGTVLLEMPIYRPSDTWFGANTTSGELCYSSRTQARTSVELLSHVPHRAVTPIVIINQAGTSLQVQQLRVPVPYLSLHAGLDGRLWTDRIKLTRDADSAEASLELLGSDALPDGSECLSGPRERAPRESLVQAFSRLFD